MINLQHLLETGNFTAFWTLFEKDEGAVPLDPPTSTSPTTTTTTPTTTTQNHINLVESFPEFDSRVRRFIVRTLTATYSTIALPALSASLSLTGEDLEDFVFGMGWTVSSSSSSSGERVVEFPTRADGDEKSSGSSGSASGSGGVAKEVVRFEQVLRIVAGAY
jgi:hypothetical protein